MFAFIGKLLGGGADGVLSDIGSVIDRFKINKEAEASRSHERQVAGLAQYSAEFAHSRSGLWGGFVDGLNRLVRPLMALSVLGFFFWVPIDPEAAASAIQAYAIVPDGLWLLASIIIGFYFGGRLQVKGKQFQLSRDKLALARTLAQQHDQRGHRVDGLGHATEKHPPDENRVIVAWRNRAAALH